MTLAKTKNIFNFVKAMHRLYCGPFFPDTLHILLQVQHTHDQLNHHHHHHHGLVSTYK